MSNVTRLGAMTFRLVSSFLSWGAKCPIGTLPESVNPAARRF